MIRPVSNRVQMFRVRRPYFDEILSGSKVMELRRASPFWRVRLLERRPGIAVFYCGKRRYKCRITGFMEFATAEEALHRPLSEQGMMDVGDGPVIAVYLGRSLALSTLEA